MVNWCALFDARTEFLKYSDEARFQSVSLQACFREIIFWLLLVLLLLLLY
jgi:hypothetical protein